MLFAVCSVFEHVVGIPRFLLSIANDSFLQQRLSSIWICTPTVVAFLFLKFPVSQEFQCSFKCPKWSCLLCGNMSGFMEGWFFLSQAPCFHFIPKDLLLFRKVFKAYSKAIF